MLASFAFIRANDFAETLNLTELFLTDEYDLMDKAFGWMLREVGKQNETVLKSYLRRHHLAMPRTMLLGSFPCGFNLPPDLNHAYGV